MRRRAKQVMRIRFRALRSAIPRQAALHRSALVASHLLAQPELQDVRAVSLFWPIERHNEVDLRSVDGALRARGVSIAYPALDEAGSHMVFRRVDDVAELEDRGRGFAEPPSSAPEVEQLDVAVVPGLAFDTRGHRIGYGAGYYDSILPRVCPPAIAVGVAYDFQLATDLPNEDGDVAVDLIVTDKRVVRVEK